MPRHRPTLIARRTSRRFLQRGQAALILLGVLLAGSGYVLVSSMNSASVAAERTQITSDALSRAKEALIAYAVSDANRPGSLPCPDANGDGQIVMNQDFIGSSCVTLVGRFPWRTLGTGDLRDGSGEQLWYALSTQFQPNLTAPLNSNSTGSLTVSGTLTGTNVVAIIFSPGAPLIRAGASSIQDRSGNCGTTPPFTGIPRCDPANYLDVIGSDDNGDGDTAYVAGPATNTFNDRLALITTDDIFPAIEIRAAREAAVLLRAHYNAWANADPLLVTNPRGWYPWAAPFSTPTTEYAGVNGQQWGLLPMSGSALAWSGAITDSGSVSTPCVLSGSTLTCTVVTADTYTLSASLNNAATAFVQPPTAGLVAVTGPASFTAGPSWTINGAALTLDFSATVQFMGPGTVTITRPPVAAWTLPASTHWLRVNNWHHVLYYGVSQGFSIQGTGICGGGPYPLCLQVDNATSGAHAVVTAMGRPIPSRVANLTVCPNSAAVGCYLEGQNAILGPAADDPLHFESNRRAGTFNDYVSVVSSN